MRVGHPRVSTADNSTGWGIGALASGPAAVRPSLTMHRPMRIGDAMMRRREVLWLLGGAAVSSIASSAPSNAQQPNRVRRIGVLMGIAETDPEAQPRVEALRSGLQALGWNSRNIQLDIRWTAGDLERTRRSAGEIAQRKPELIVVHSTPAVKALRELVPTTPMVFVLIGDPIGSGFVNSIARPGGTLTGFMNVDAPMAGKWLELITEVAPKVKRVALIYNPRTSPYQSYLSSFAASAPVHAVQAVPTPVVDAAELENAMTALGQQPDSALFVVPDVFVQVHRELIIKLADKYRLPAVYPYRFFASSGGLMSYGLDTIGVFRQAATYVDRILKGAKPADLPVQSPRNFQLVVNLKTAKAIGLTIPEAFLLRADEVIE
jgi:putative ABC transport system substrate-binding protein